jgi:tetratricopeptide (TPR) repeat protein
VKHFTPDFREREDDSSESQKAIDYYTGARRYFEQKIAETLTENSQNPAGSDGTADDARWTELRADFGRAVSRLGEALRFAGRIDEALECKIKSLEVWETLRRPRAIHLARIRLAVVLDQTGRAEDADRALEILTELRAALNENAHADLTVYADFIHESLALVRLRRGEASSAPPELEAALEIRVQRGQAKMIERTRELLRRAREESERSAIS